MRNFLILALLAVSTLAHANLGDPEDIVIKSRLDKESSGLLVQRIRAAMMNTRFGDPYNQSFPKPMVMDFTQLLDELPEDTQSWIKEFQTLVSLKLFESVYKLRVENFSYSVDHFSSELQPFPEGLSRIEYVTHSSVQGLKLSAKKIAFQVELQRTQSGEPIKFDIELIEPEFIVSPELVMELPMGWHSSLLPTALQVSLHTIDLSKIFAKIAANPSLVNLEVKDFIIPNVSIKVGNRTLTFDRAKIRQFLTVREDELKVTMIDLLKAKMEERFSNIILNQPQEVFLPRYFSVAAAISPVFALRSMDANQESKLLEIMVDGHFCADRNDIANDNCRGNQLQSKIRRVIGPEIFEQSIKDIENLFAQKKANIAVSISEHYLNQVISAAANAGMLDLAGDDFALGSEKAFILADEKGEGFSLYLDIIYKLTNSERILVGKNELRFPVKLSIGIKISNINGYPRFQIKVLANKTDERLLSRGLPHYDLKSTVNSARFQKKVLARIMERLKPFDSKVLVDVELKDFKNTYLEQLNFHSDGKGRATAVLNMINKK